MLPVALLWRELRSVLMKQVDIIQRIKKIQVPFLKKNIFYKTTAMSYEDITMSYETIAIS